MMKILIVQSRLCFGGAERVGVMWANNFVKCNNEVIIATNLHLESSYDIEKKVELSNIFPQKKKSITKWFLAIRALRRLLIKEKPDVIIGIMSTCSLISKIASLGFKIPIIASEHNSFERPISAPITKWNYFTKFHLNKLYDVVTVLTHADKDFIGSRLKNVFVMPNPLPIEPLSLNSAPISNTTSSLILNENYVLATGRLDAWHYKGFDILIKAWANVIQKYEDKGMLFDWKLLIAGKDEDGGLDYLKKLTHEYNVEDSILFLGFIRNMKNIYQKSSVFVLPSRYEGFGLVLIEAMSQGCACIACDYKGRQAEIFASEKNGILCETESVNSLSTAIEKVLTDDEYRKSLQNNALERSYYYLPSNISKRWELLLTNVVNKNE